MIYKLLALTIEINQSFVAGMFLALLLSRAFPAIDWLAKLWEWVKTRKNANS
jgi:hypothetical protein